MLGNEETLQLVLSANDKASAILEKVRSQIVATGGAANAGGKSTKGLSDEIDRISDRKLITSARAMSSIARAADEARLGSKEAGRAMGELAEMVALASGSARFAGWAIGLNAVVTAATTLFTILRDSPDQMKPTEEYLKRISHLTADNAASELANARAARDSARARYLREASSGIRDRNIRTNAAGLTTEGLSLMRQGGVRSDLMDRADANYETIWREVVTRIAPAERSRLLALKDQTEEMARQKGVELELGELKIRGIRHQESSLDLQRDEARASKLDADAQAEKMFRLRLANGELHKLTAAELAMKGQLLERNKQIFQQQIDSAQASYDDRISEDKFQQQQIVWYARRKLSQSDFQTSLDDARRAYESQIHALERTSLNTADLRTEQDRITEAYQLQLALINQQHDIQVRHLRTQNDIDQSAGGLFGAGDARDQHKARLSQIEDDRLAGLKANKDDAAAQVEVNRKAQIAIRAENRRVIDETRQNYKTIEDVLLASKSRQIKAIGHAAQTIRRLEIGAEGAHSAVLALKAGGQGLAALGSGNFAGAAEYFAAAVQFGAAAALAGQESLGGGGSAGSGGGGSQNVGTFEPRDNGAGGGGTTINLYTTNPYGREQIQQVKFELDRANVMRRPGIEIPPTTGIRVVS